MVNVTTVEKVYEVVDLTDPDHFYSLGIFFGLENARHAIDNALRTYGQTSRIGSDVWSETPDEVIEIHEIEAGIFGDVLRRPVYRLERAEDVTAGHGCKWTIVSERDFRAEGEPEYIYGFGPRTSRSDRCFRKRPVVIRAFRYKRDPIPEWMRRLIQEGTISEVLPHGGLAIHTPEGVMYAHPGDWIVLGLKGEVYPVKHEIFMETYEEVEDDEDEAAA